MAGLRCCFSPAGVPAGAARALLSCAAAQETGPEMDLYPPVFINSIIFPSLGWPPMRELFVPLRWQPPIFGKSGVCFFPRFWLQSCLALHGCPTGNLQPCWGSGCAKLGHSGKGGLSLLLFLLVSPSERIPVQGEIFLDVLQVSTCSRVHGWPKVFRTEQNKTVSGDFITGNHSVYIRRSQRQ